ncbi:MAG: tetratricopeptide repeat protein [Candidatus Latescibacteria bacterium]|nr:tetratricopeptide repeat protein [Candidatus Latescibacterota bacterium]
MSKATTIRKKALDLVRDQDWPNAIKEYRRLVELDQNNPNVHNELADLYLKTNQRNEAFDSFMQAIDEYTRVGLYNNAVAVCKKVLRVLPARVEVLNKLGLIRVKQGLTKEAESYYVSFLDKAAGGSFEAQTFKKLASAIADEIPGSPSVLQKLAQCLLGYRLNDEAADVLIKLYLAQEKNGDTSGCEDTRALVAKLGVAAKLDAVAGKSGKPVDRTVVTEDNLWTKKHSEGERIDVESTPRFTPPNQPTTAPASPQPAGAVSGGPSERDQWLLRLARGVGGGPPKTKAPAPAEAPAASTTVAEKEKPATAPAAPAPTFAASDAEAEDIVDDRLNEETTATAVEANAEPDLEDVEDAGEAEAATEPADDGLDLDDDLPPIPEAPPAAVRPASPAPAKAAPKEAMQISALIDDDDAGPNGEEDYRSHYDLGMAYIEMDLLSEAIREYQIASKSPQFQVKCLEMIGVCFLKQNQPQLAIRQLTKGLSLIGDDGEESMGIKYNLGLAYELIGDVDSARTHFEDVYVVDVTFRDVAEKISKLSGS